LYECASSLTLLGQTRCDLTLQTVKRVLEETADALSKIASDVVAHSKNTATHRDIGDRFLAAWDAGAFNTVSRLPTVQSRKGTDGNVFLFFDHSPPCPRQSSASASSMSEFSCRRGKGQARHLGVVTALTNSYDAINWRLYFYLRHSVHPLLSQGSSYARPSAWQKAQRCRTGQAPAPRYGRRYR
jgi:hypothetical protein